MIGKRVYIIKRLKKKKRRIKNGIWFLVTKNSTTKKEKGKKKIPKAQKKKRKSKYIDMLNGEKTKESDNLRRFDYRERLRGIT